VPGTLFVIASLAFLVGSYLTDNGSEAGRVNRLEACRDCVIAEGQPVASSEHCP
jgi:hypothetical protein